MHSPCARMGKSPAPDARAQDRPDRTKARATMRNAAETQSQARNAQTSKHQRTRRMLAMSPTQACRCDGHAQCTIMCHSEHVSTRPPATSMTKSKERCACSFVQCTVASARALRNTGLCLAFSCESRRHAADISRSCRRRDSPIVDVRLIRRVFCKPSECGGDAF